MEAIVLAGGLGTRLWGVISDIPKPMAPVSGRPFLAYILDDLQRQGVMRAIIATGYKHEVITAHFGRFYNGLELIYSIENEPLGTGGAIQKALMAVAENSVVILNGDTFFRVDLAEMLETHAQLKAELIIALKPMQNFDRYGVVRTAGKRIIGFVEKQPTDFGLINGGVYLLEKSALARLNFPSKFSFEKDFLEHHVNTLFFGAYVCDNYFIDIGIPTDYVRANQEFPLP